MCILRSTRKSESRDWIGFSAQEHHTEKWSTKSIFTATSVQKAIASKKRDFDEEMQAIITVM